MICRFGAWSSWMLRYFLLRLVGLIDVRLFRLLLVRRLLYRLRLLRGLSPLL